MRFLLALSLTMLCATGLNAQAFGVEMGKPVSDYSGKRGSRPYAYIITPPALNPEFTSYISFATPQTGVCKVVGIGRTHRNDDYGSEVKGKFDDLARALDDKYGQSEKFNVLKTGAIWDEPREWVWSIYKNERTVSAYWIRGNAQDLPPTVEAMRLKVNSVNPVSGAYLTLTYEFSNYDACKAIFDQAESSGL